MVFVVVRYVHWYLDGVWYLFFDGIRHLLVDWVGLFYWYFYWVRYRLWYFHWHLNNRRRHVKKSC